MTPQRIALLRLLVSSEEHPSAAQLYDQIKSLFPTTSLATVYKTLTLLYEMGELLELGFSDDVVRYDARKPYPHPHLICVQCHKIRDAEAAFVEGWAEKITQESGFAVISHRLDFYGLCPDCQKAQ